MGSSSRLRPLLRGCLLVALTSSRGHCFSTPLRRAPTQRACLACRAAPQPIPPPTASAPEDLTGSILTFLNSALDDAVRAKWVLTQSPLGEEAMKKNAFTQGSFRVTRARVLDMNLDGLDMEVDVQEKRFLQGVQERRATTLVPWPELQRDDVATGSPAALRRALMAMARRAQAGDVMGGEDASVKLLDLPLGPGAGAGLSLPANWFLNNVPHSSEARQYIYGDVANALLQALQPGSGLPLRSQITVLVPETNPSMDTFRIGTMLEMLREAALTVAYGGVDGTLKKVRLLVQPSMGEGAFTAMPLSLSGVRALLEMMDWGDLPPAVAAQLPAEDVPDAQDSSAAEDGDAGAGPGLSTAPAGRRRNRAAGLQAAPSQGGAAKPKASPGRGRANYGQLIEVRGPPQLRGLISFGTLGADAVDDDVDLYISISPQNIVGGNVLEPLEELTKAAERRGQRVMVVNPRLEDRPSPNDVMQIRGRAERRAFAESFQANELYQLRLLYTSGVAYFPIRGALYRKSYREPYVLSVRKDVDRADRAAIARFGTGVREVYASFFTFEDRPRDKEITEAFQQSRV